ncbi:putative cell division cycle protein 123 protein [Rosellinia necatrix]|uniref:Putative cell division cycle protein 123 protein n=1 Tax=Rosellinia necatrix TaxID=77044 RepID=A0A1W2TNS0_ROSNE|nr:putative cell division cycle protein 123 protein [Rosellinia necatrix]
MPSFTQPQADPTPSNTPPALQFPPITRDHILNCSYDSWFPKYRASCIKSRIIPLSPEFVAYIREDGILLADEDGAESDDDDDEEWQSAPSTTRPPIHEVDSDSDSDDADEPPKLPPNKRFPELHQLIKDTIAELGGSVAPKLNWTAPKDATWISPHQNTIKCTSPNDVYLLLKSSNFITYDLEHAFDDCTPVANAATHRAPFKPVLVLRSYFNPHTAMEFRCFVKHRNIVAISQRDLNYFEFLQPLKADIIAKIYQLFNNKLRYTFPDGNFAFDVYIPEGEGEPLSRARLIDINAWAPHTDSLLFGWQELLDLEVPNPILGVVDEESTKDQGANTEDDETSEDEEGEDFTPELRLVEKEDAAAFNFSSPQYSAHKLPKDVVDAGMAGGGGMREFARKWREMTGMENIANWETNGSG